ncbi:MAG: hypothetical protein J7J68_06080 [Thermotogaceae bacterium]|nr:hypothetical protein [Thermotogaceae bacterium]
MRIDPLVVTKKVQQGDTFTYSIFVENADSFNSVTVEAFAADFVETVEGAYQVVKPGTTPYSAASWIKINPTNFTISPASGKEVSVRVTVPRGVMGGKYAAVVFRIVPPKSEGTEEGAISVMEFQFQMASFLELTVQGGRERIEAYAVDFKVQKLSEIPSLVEIRKQLGADATVFTTTVLNQGNIHVVARGELTLKTDEGRTLAKMQLGAGRGVILPGAKVYLRTVTARKFPPGNYVARAVVDYGGHRPAIIESQFTVEGTNVAVVGSESEVEIARILVEPDNIEMMVKPGTFRSEVVEITNRGDEKIEVRGRILPLVYDIQGNLVEESERGEPVEWIEMKPSSFSLRPNQSRRVRIAVRAPKESSGGYYSDIVFETMVKGIKTESGANLLVYLGDEESVVKTASLKIKDFSVHESGVDVDFLLNNEGTIHIQPTLTVALDRYYPQEEKEGGIIIAPRTERLTTATYDIENPILPGTEREIGLTLPLVLESGEYEILVRCDYGGSEPAVLRYRFKVEGGTQSE